VKAGTAASWGPQYSFDDVTPQTDYSLAGSGSVRLGGVDTQPSAAGDSESFRQQQLARIVRLANEPAALGTVETQYRMEVHGTRETMTNADFEFSNRVAVDIASRNGEDLAPTVANAARLRLEAVDGGLSGVELAQRFGHGLVGALKAVTIEPVLQLRDMGMALASVTYNEVLRGDGDAQWFPEMKSGIAEAYANGASQTRLVMQSNPLTGIGVLSYDLTTASMNRDWGAVAEMGGGLVGGFALGKATSAYGGYGVRWAPGDIGTMPMQYQRGATSLLNFDVVRPTPRFTSEGLQIPFGFKSEQEFMDFSAALRAGLPAGVEPVFQGSSATGIKAVSSGGIKAGTPFDVGRVSDFDIGLISEDLATRAAVMDGMRVKTMPTRIGPLDTTSSAELGLGGLAERLSAQANRPVSFVLYDSMEGAYSQFSLFVPKPPR
jgi:hypothetical protein